MKTILTINAGSSSLKFAIFDISENAPSILVSGQADGLGVNPSIKITNNKRDTIHEQIYTDVTQTDQAFVLQKVIDFIKIHLADIDIVGVGHRIVHGGVNYEKPMVLDTNSLAELARLNRLAPLHQPHNLAGVDVAIKAFPNARQIACFDTAFHRKHPWVNDTFALPREYYDKGVRRYGFHGLSYEYIVNYLLDNHPEHAEGKVVIAHLGNGASMCAIQNGQSIGSTMGFSALDGLPMGTRCGQLDPAIVLYLLEEEKLNARQISDILYKQSGLKGLSGLSSDMRELEASDKLEARQAIDYFVFRIRRELGAMAAILGGLDSLVFCGGIGENSVNIRDKVCDGFQWLGLELDKACNQSAETVISTDASRVKVFVIQTDEERMIAQHTCSLLVK